MAENSYEYWALGLHPRGHRFEPYTAHANPVVTTQDREGEADAVLP